VLLKIAEAFSTQALDGDVYYVFSVQEEVGCRGAKPAAYSIEPEVGIAIDVTAVGGKPGAPTMDVKLGGGAAIKIKDASVICSYEIVNKMRELAKENKVKYQEEILIRGGTDTSAMQISKGGCLAGAISVPSAYIHSVNEMIDMSDVKEIVKLATLVAERI
jgi:endoglucanase